MKQHCKCALRTYMTHRLSQARKEIHFTQARFSEKLMMDTRSYAALERGENLCCTLTFIIYLVFYCKDIEKLILELREIILAAYNDECHAL